VAIARALVSDPALIVCDEPTASLDGESGRAVLQMLRSAALNEGRAIVVVTHDTRVFPFGDRMAEMIDGRIVAIKNDRAIFARGGVNREEVLDRVGGLGGDAVFGVLGSDFNRDTSRNQAGLGAASQPV
jgi:energy-coupling factor transporter ATP-binding protein EcfA2